MKLIRSYFQRIQRIRKEGSLFLDTDLIICHPSEILENWFLFSTGDTFTRLSVFSFCYFFIHFGFSLLGCVEQEYGATCAVLMKPS